MAAKILKFHGEAREKVRAGLNILANAVKVTLGPKGRLVMLERSFGPPTVINSGVIVAKEIELEGQVRKPGCANGTRGCREDIGDCGRWNDDGDGSCSSNRQ